MNIHKFLLALLMSVFALGANAQVEAKMKALQAKGFGARNTAAQKADSTAQADTEATGDTEPSFPGGEAFLQAYLKKKLLHNGISGKGDVVVSFTVDKTGLISGAEVTQSAGSALDTEAYNIVTRMPRWKPGTTDGQPVEKPASVTIRFGAEE